MNDTLDRSPREPTSSTHLPGGVQMPTRMRLPELIAAAYRNATASLRVQILERLLRPVGLLGLMSLAAGAFAEFLRRGDYRGLVILPEDVAGISTDHVVELVHYVEQRSPETFQMIVQLLADNPTGLVGIGGSLLLIALQASRTHDRA